MTNLKALAKSDPPSTISEAADRPAILLKTKTGTVFNYRETVRYGGAVGPGAFSRRFRDVIIQDDLSATDRAIVQATDIELLSAAIGDEEDAVEPSLLDDDPDQPLSHWWWHLGALRAGTFPLDQLPDDLVPIYHEVVAERDLDEGE